MEQHNPGEDQIDPAHGGAEATIDGVCAWAEARPEGWPGRAPSAGSPPTWGSLLAAAVVDAGHQGEALAAFCAAEGAAAAARATVEVRGPLLDLVPGPEGCVGALLAAIDTLRAGSASLALVCMEGHGARVALGLRCSLHPTPRTSYAGLARCEGDAGTFPTAAGWVDALAAIAAGGQSTPPAAGGRAAVRLTSPPPPQPTPELPQTRSALLDALLDVQRQADEAHAAFSRNMSRAHLDWLEGAEATLDSLEAALNQRAARPEPETARLEPIDVETARLEPIDAEATDAERESRRRQNKLQTLATWSTERLVLQRITAPTVHLAAPCVHPGARAEIIGGETALAGALIEGLERRGLSAARTYAPSGEGDLVVLLDGLISARDLATALTLVDEADTLTSEVASIRDGCPGVVVAAFDAGGSFGQDASPSHHAPLAAIAASFRERASVSGELTLKALDLERGTRSPRALAHLIIEEIFEGGPEVEVARRAHGARSTRVELPVRHHTPVGRPSDAPERWIAIASDPGADPILAALAGAGRRLTLLTPKDPDHAAERLASLGVHVDAEALGDDPGLVAVALSRAMSADPQAVVLIEVGGEDDPVGPARWRAALDATIDHPLEVLGVISVEAAGSPLGGAAEEVMAQMTLAEAAQRRDCRAKLVRVPPRPSVAVCRQATAELLAGPRDDLRVRFSGPAEDERTQTVRACALLEPRRHGFLAAYAPQGRRTLPPALLIDWFVRLAYGCCPDMAFDRLSDLVLLGKPDLSAWPTGTVALDLCAEMERSRDEATLKVSLRDDSGAATATAEVRMRRSPEALPAEVPSIDEADLVPARRELSRWLGPEGLDLSERFQVIGGLETTAAGDAVALVRVERSQVWPGTFWTDPAHVNAVLLLAGRLLGGEGAHPTGVGSYRRFDQVPHEGVVRCLFTPGRSGTLDATLTDGHGAPLAQLESISAAPRARSTEGP